MADSNYSATEEQREEFRKRMLTPKEMQEPGHRFFRLTRIISCIALVLALSAGVFFEYENADYTTYQVQAEILLTGLEKSSSFAFQEGTIVLGQDSVSYVKDKAIAWTLPVSSDDLRYKTEGGYFALFEPGSYEFGIYDESGFLTTVKVSRKIYGMDISSAGVTAVFTESDEYSYISYFDRYGQKLSVEIRTVLNTGGYPMDLAISPDGQKLAVVYYAIQGGAGVSRFVLYDFENGREASSYIVGQYEDYQETDTLLLGVLFTDNSHAVAFGDNRISFVSLNDGTNTARTEVSFQDQILSVVSCDDRLAIETQGQDFELCSLYEKDGSLYNTFKVPKGYELLAAKSRNLLFTKENDLTIYNSYGHCRYTGTLSVTPVSICFVDRTRLLLSTAEGIHIFWFY